MEKQFNLEILICTHNRVGLLESAIDSLNQASRPGSVHVSLLVIANACTDGTRDFLRDYARRVENEGTLPLRWYEEKKPGKSHALNLGISVLNSDMVAFVDDDHRVDCNFLVRIADAWHDYPVADLWCGRILPDWDGWEPAWAHERDKYVIYPLPVPKQVFGDEPKALSVKGRLPGGGNLIVRCTCFKELGGFSIDLGPKGHDLGGGEDSEFVLRALDSGLVLQYVPHIVQYHYVDVERFTLWYVMKKAYQRSRSITQIEGGGSWGVPKYVWRKLMGYVLHIVTSLYWPEQRFYLVRLAATWGEVSGYWHAWRSVKESAHGSGERG